MLKHNDVYQKQILNYEDKINNQINLHTNNNIKQLNYNCLIDILNYYNQNYFIEDIISFTMINNEFCSTNYLNHHQELLTIEDQIIYILKKDKLLINDKHYIKTKETNWHQNLFKSFYLIDNKYIISIIGYKDNNKIYITPNSVNKLIPKK